MTPNQVNIFFEQLRVIRETINKIHSTVDETAKDVKNLQVRMTAVENGIGNLQTGLAAVHGRLDGHDDRLSRIERRLELTEAPA